MLRDLESLRTAGTARARLAAPIRVTPGGRRGERMRRMTEHRGSTKHSPVRDDVLKAETELLKRGGVSRAEEWRQPEEGREESERPTAAPSNDPHATGGTPPGMDAADVRGRTELARW